MIKFCTSKRLTVSTNIVVKQLIAKFFFYMSKNGLLSFQSVVIKKKIYCPLNPNRFIEMTIINFAIQTNIRRVLMYLCNTFCSESITHLYVAFYLQTKFNVSEMGMIMVVGLGILKKDKEFMDGNSNGNIWGVRLVT